MKEVVEYLKDSFVDFNGKVHNFILCAVSRVADDDCELVSNNGIMPIERTLSLGCSICNLNDEYNEELGKKIAYNRALSEKFAPTIASTVKGVINSAVVNALLTQEANYIKRDPNCVIRGYNEQAAKVLAKKKAQETFDALTSEEQMIVKLANKYDLDYYARLAKELNK